MFGSRVEANFSLHSSLDYSISLLYYPATAAAFSFQCASSQLKIYDQNVNVDNGIEFVDVMRVHRTITRISKNGKLFPLKFIFPLL